MARTCGAGSAVDGMRRAVLILAGACLLAAPTVLAFFSGGFFTQPRLIAGSWLAARAVRHGRRAGAAADAPPRAVWRSPGWSRSTAWSALSILWAPQAGPAVQNVQRLAALRRRAAARGRHAAGRRPAARRRAGAGRRRRDRDRLRPVGPAAARTSSTSTSSRSAGGGSSSRSPTGTPRARWPRSGSCCAPGSPATATRPRAMRFAAAAARARPRAGRLPLLLARRARGRGRSACSCSPRSRRHARSCARGAALGRRDRGGRLAVAGVHRSCCHATRDGSVMLAVLVAAGAVSAFLVARTGAEPPEAPRWYARLGPAAWLAAGAVAAGLIVGGIAERPSERELSAGAGATRLTSCQLQPLRVLARALREFGTHPLPAPARAGSASSGCRSGRSARRSATRTRSSSRSPPSSGSSGCSRSRLMFGGVAVTARRALAAPRAARRRPPAALVVWFLHASIDWDWEMPAVTLPALVLAGLLIAQSEGEPATAAAPPAERVESSHLRCRLAARAPGRRPPLTQPSAVQALRLSGSDDDVLQHGARVRRRPAVHRTSARATSGVRSGFSNRASRGPTPRARSSAGCRGSHRRRSPRS